MIDDRIETDDANQNAQQPLLAMAGIDKAFPGVQALRNARLDVNAGEIHALLGENGAGKSTLIKILGGVHQPDAGTISFAGSPCQFPFPAASQAAGIAIIYQEFNLCPALSVRDNIFLYGGPSRRWIGVREERRLVNDLFARLNVPIDAEARCDTLSVAEQQIVEIARALSKDARLLIMDEPTAALTDQEIEQLFEIVRSLRDRGIAVIYVSHRLDEIFALCDRATVMRDGQYVDTKSVAELSRRELIEMMVGRKLENEFPPRTDTKQDDAAPVIEIRDLGRDGVVAPSSFSVQRGEIVALTGLAGAGRTELVRLIFGADIATSGEIFLHGKRVAIKSPRDAIAAGICLLTEDRKQQGLVLGHSVRENFGLPNLRRFSAGAFLRQRAERDAFATYTEKLQIKLADQEQTARNLSGGNQQKVVLAKWLQRHAELLIFDEPTRGIDVGAKYEIYQLMNDLVAQGKAIIMISSELPEVLGMADRILVMREGTIVAEIIDVANATQQQIMAYAVGTSRDAKYNVGISDLPPTDRPAGNTVTI